MVRALIVDDESHDREVIREMLVADGSFRIEGECDNGDAAVPLIRELPLDVIFLDVQMPQLDGFGVIEAVGAEKMPGVVFTTASEASVVRVFERQQLDYLRKPFDRLRFSQVLARLKRHGAAPHLGNLLPEVRPESTNRIAVAIEGRIRFVPTDDIRWVEDGENCVRLHMRGQKLAIRETFQNLEERLDSDRFVRIHRSTLVNVRFVRDVRPWYTGEYVVVLEGGRELTLSRGYRASLRRLRATGRASS